MWLSPLYVNRSTVINFTLLPRPQLHMVFIEHLRRHLSCLYNLSYFQPQPLCIKVTRQQNLQNQHHRLFGDRVNSTAMFWATYSTHTCVRETVFVICTLTFVLYRNKQFTIQQLTCYLQRLQFHSIKPAAPCHIQGKYRRLARETFARRLRESKKLSKSIFTC